MIVYSFFRMKSFLLKVLNKIVVKHDKSDEAYLFFIAEYQRSTSYIQMDVFREGFKMSVRLMLVIFLSVLGFVLLFYTFLIDTKIEKCKVAAYIGLPISVSKRLILFHQSISCT